MENEWCNIYRPQGLIRAADPLKHFQRKLVSKFEFGLVRSIVNWNSRSIDVLPMIRQSLKVWLKAFWQS